ncbi:LamG domain-containing protein [Acidovorax sp. DW039]|uniref:LamG-like jellyroll fold domain-containing protein n=1 Tax=Acidovorax sp. DW039 TaxID=3095606 RepID=UPI00308B17F8|nr:LamG domain-containing protein [Acidovorax sp. DW039]
MAVPSFNFGAGDWEIEFWLKVRGTESSYGSIVANGISSFIPGARFVMVYGTGDPRAGRLAVGGSDAARGSGVYEADGNPVVVSASLLPINEWIHVAVNKTGTAMRIWLGGQLSGTGSSSAAWDFTISGLLLGRNGWDGGASRLNAVVADMKVRTVPVRTAAFTPPLVPDGWAVLLGESVTIAPGNPSIDAVTSGGTLAAALGVASYGAGTPARARLSAVALAAAASSSAPVMRATVGLLARDTEFGGSGRLWGTTKTEISPGVFVPTKARVSVLRQRDMQLARQVWSDPATGAWEVRGLDTSQTFLEVAQHVTGEKQAVAADQTTPVEVSS